MSTAKASGGVDGHISLALMNHGSPARMSPVDAARAFIASEFPEAAVGIVAGSFLRGEDTPTSDLDVMIVTSSPTAPFRASFRAFDWPIEAFVHTGQSHRWYFRTDYERRTPTLATICAEGIVVRDTNGTAAHLQGEARLFITNGPPPLTATEQEDLRYHLTAALDDLVGTEDQTEGPFIAHQVAEAAVTLLLLINRQWIGQGKWTVRALRRFDERHAARLGRGVAEYYATGDTVPLIEFAHDVLDMAGGPVFEGYYRAGVHTDTS